MGAETKIEWCDHSWSPWRGCEHATLPDGSEHPGCGNCYAETMSVRNPKTLGVWGPDGKRVMAAPASWDAVRRWNAEAERAGVRQSVFPSLCDPFEDWQGEVHDHKGVPIVFDGICVNMHDLRLDLFRLIDETPWLDWLLLTKRPQNVLRMWPGFDNRCEIRSPDGTLENPEGHKRSNVWLITSISDQATADALMPSLLELWECVPVLGVSAEPLLGPIDLSRWIACEETGTPWLRWVIVGGESGHHARPMHPDWARSLRDQCQAAGVAFFFKQWGEWAPCTMMGGLDLWPYGKGHFADWLEQTANFPHSTIGWHYRSIPGGMTIVAKVGKKAAGRLLDGRTWDEMPGGAVSAGAG